MASPWLEDLRRYPGPWPRRVRNALARPGFWALSTFRLLDAARRLPRPLELLVQVWARPLHLAVSLATGVELQPGARLGPGIYIGHFGGVVVSHRATLGARCNLSQGVTVCEARGPEGRLGAPVIGERVHLGPGAKVLGPIRVGNDVAIGPNAVVARDVPDGVVVGGVPAAIVSQGGSRGLIDLEGAGLPAPGSARNVVCADGAELPPTSG